MNWLLCNYRRVYYTLVALAVPLFLLSLWHPALMGAIPLYLLGVLVCYVLSGRMISRAASRGIAAYYRDCDPGPMLDNCDRLLRGVEDGGGDYVAALRENRADCLLSLGRLPEARQELERLSDIRSRSKATTGAVECQCMWIELSLAENRTQGLEREIEQARTMAARNRVPSMFSGLTLPQLVEWRLEGYSCALLLGAAGPVPQLAVRLRKLLETAPCGLYQVQTAWTLAQYHLARGEEGSALPYLRLVAQRGAKLAVGRQAAYKLKGLGE